MIHKTTTIDKTNISDILNDTEGVDWISWLIDHEKLKDYRHSFELYFKVIDGVVYFQANDRITQAEMSAAAADLTAEALLCGCIDSGMRGVDVKKLVLSAIRKHVYDIGDSPDTRQEIYDIWEMEEYDHE